MPPAMWPYIKTNCTRDTAASPYRLMLDSVQNSTTNATTRFCFATAPGPAISNMSIAHGGEGELVEGAPLCAVRLYANLFEIDLGIGEYYTEQAAVAAHLSLALDTSQDPRLGSAGDAVQLKVMHFCSRSLHCALHSMVMIQSSSRLTV